MRRIFLTLLLIFSLMPANISHTQEISGLSLEECLELALMNHPSLKRAKSSTKDLSAQLESLRANNRVIVGLTGSTRYQKLARKPMSLDMRMNGMYDIISDVVVGHLVIRAAAM